MAEQPMETTLRTALWQQFGAAIDMLENALLACPETLWQGHLWIDAEGPEYGTFWEITYHTLCPPSCIKVAVLGSGYDR